MESTNQINHEDPSSSYWMNPSDSALLSLVENFQRQFFFLHPERKALFILPLSEDGHRRFVPTTVCPSRPSVPQLLTWRGCSSFVADFLIHQDRQEEPPYYLGSPSLVLQRGRSSSSSCWEASVLLLSLLLGAGYDAYCVSGYTTQEQGQAPPTDGRRLSCWVLVLCGRRSVTESFFIDSRSGVSSSIHSKQVTGIESVWNNLNYYVNMQDCRGRCAELHFEFEDLRFWEPVLFRALSPQQQDQHTASVLLRSWVKNFTVTDKVLQQVCPSGQRLMMEDKTSMIERFTLREDGLIERTTTHTDTQLSQVSHVTEVYRWRTDGLKQRHINMINGWTTERFTPKRPDNLLCYRWRGVGGGSEQWVEFGGAREDQLISRVMSSEDMMERFEGRSDRLYLRHTIFGTSAHTHTQQDAPVQRVVEHFHRNPSTTEDQDVSQKVFLIPERRIQVIFHSQRLVQSQTTFFKPAETPNQDRGQSSCFLVNLEAPPPQPVSLCRSLRSLMKDEETTLRHVERAQQEMREITSIRNVEETNVELINATTSEQTRTHRHKEEHEEELFSTLMSSLGLSAPLSSDQVQQLHRHCVNETTTRLTEQLNLIQERLHRDTAELEEQQLWFQNNHQNMSENQLRIHQHTCSHMVSEIRAAHTRLHRDREKAPVKLKMLKQKLLNDPRLSTHLIHTD